jgi:hypothetical protein
LFHSNLGQVRRGRGRSHGGHRQGPEERGHAHQSHRAFPAYRKGPRGLIHTFLGSTVGAALWEHFGTERN